MELKEAVALIYSLSSEDITEDSDSEYIQAKEVVEKFINCDEVDPRNLIYTRFPDCHKRCSLVKILGVGECENIKHCKHKFKESK